MIIFNRLQFAKRWVGKKKHTRTWVFSDEHKMSVNDFTARTMLLVPGRKVIPRAKQDCRNIPRVMVWAAIGLGVRSPLVVFPQENDADSDNEDARTRKRTSALRPTTIDELARSAKKVWNDLPQSLIDNFVLGFDNKLKRCVASRGEK